MKKFAFIGILGGIAAFCFLVGFAFVIALKANVALRKELTQKKEELRDAQKASRKLADLEKQSAELAAREEKVKRQVARQELKPFGLIREITGTGAKAGLRSMRFEMLALAEEGQEAVVGIRELPFVMKFEAAFPQLLAFLADLSGIERIVAVKSVEIQRQPANVPYLSVTAVLSSYSFPE